MKPIHLIAAAGLLAFPTLPAAADGQVPVMRTNGATAGALPGAITTSPATDSAPGAGTAPAAGETSSAAGARIVVTKPTVPESPVEAKPLPHQVTPEEMHIRRSADEAIEARAAAVGEACATSLTARIDWSEIGAEDILHASPDNTCGAALDALQEYCATSDGRARVAQGVKSLICTAGSPPAIELRSGTLIYTLDFQSRNPGAFVYAWLARHL